jgi:DNA processing protein
MNVDSRVEAWARLQLSGVAPRALFELLRTFGSPESVLDATHAQRCRHVESKVATLLDAPPEPNQLEATLAWLREPGHELIAWGDPDFPQPLLEIGDSPPVLYCMGRRELLMQPAFAIVGSRNATPQGCADAEAFAAALSAAGLAIVSGLALGIDAAAHRGGLSGAGSSIAVIGTGPDRVYPARNRHLAHELAARGLVLSEFALGTPPLKQNFPRRNRVVSGLARGVLVVEATLSSGSLITARLAGDQGREVFALPGSIHSPFSKGAHKLIREGAKLVETAQDILAELGIAAAPAAPAATPKTQPRAAMRRILRALGHDPAEPGTVAMRARLSLPDALAALTELEIDGRVASLPGGTWQRVDRA